MSSYISTDNQNLLWRLLHQHHLFTQCTEEYKTNVFRQTVETIYYEIQPNTSLTYKELQLLNQEKNKVIQELYILEESFVKFGKEIQEKYGEGVLNLKTGKVTNK